MTPAQRDAYFKKVRLHANALAELLESTLFDDNPMRELRDDELEKPLGSVLRDRGVDEDDGGHVVAFHVSIDGPSEMHYNYPDCVFTKTLWNVVDWTAWDDQWDGGFFSSSAPIVQANAESTRAVYFTCMVSDWFDRERVEIPFPILATLANVALELGPDDLLDEDSARKQVRRYQARQAKRKAERSLVFEDSGQNSNESDNSVLSDPF